MSRIKGCASKRARRALSATLALALTFALTPGLAFAASEEGQNATTGNGGQAPGGWFDGEGVSGVDLQGKEFEIHAGIVEVARPFEIALTSEAPSNWPTGASNALGTFVSISGNAGDVSGTVEVHFAFDSSYDGFPLVYYIENADGSTAVLEGGFVGDTQYLTSSIVVDTLEFQDCTIGVAFGSGFDDVNGATPHADHIAWLAAQGISTGFPDGTFRPYDPVARCDMAAFLYRLAGSPEYEPSEEAKARFSDVDEGTPHAKEVWWLAEQGITTGFPDGTFRPYDTIVRCDMAAFLHRLAGEGAGAGGDLPPLRGGRPLRHGRLHAPPVRRGADRGVFGLAQTTRRPAGWGTSILRALAIRERTKRAEEKRRSCEDHAFHRPFGRRLVRGGVLFRAREPKRYGAGLDHLERRRRVRRVQSVGRAVGAPVCRRWNRRDAGGGA